MLALQRVVGHFRDAFTGRAKLGTVVLYWGVIGNGIWLSVAMLVFFDQLRLGVGQPGILGPLRPVFDVESKILVPGMYAYFPLSIWLMWKNAGNSPRYPGEAAIACACLLMIYITFLVTSIVTSFIIGQV